MLCNLSEDGCGYESKVSNRQHRLPRVIGQFAVKILTCPQTSSSSVFEIIALRCPRFLYRPQLEILAVSPELD